ncbi:MAG: Holliday junction resolvase Hjc [Candidatus Bathyarchaeia archaeon]
MRRKGYRAERELVRKLRSWGFKSVRVPVSAPSSEPLPDVFATKGDTLLAFEIKAPNSERTYFQKKQIKKLFDFLNMFEAYTERIAIIGAKFPYKWVFRKVEEVDDYVIHKKEKSQDLFLNWRTMK